jgi:hypothetical protein
VADVFDAGEINSVVADIEPEVVVSLLTTLPKRGPMRVKDFEPARALWGRGAPNLVAAAQRAGVRRVVAESVIFAYGYPTSGSALMDESDPYPGPPPLGGEAMLNALRGMERTVLTSGDHSDTEGIVLRYGIFYGPDVPHTQMFTRLAKWWAMPAVTGDGIVSWIHIDDVAKATADAVDKGRGGQIYNIVDDRPQSLLTTSVSCPPNCTGRSRCRCPGDCSGSSRHTGRSRSVTHGCRCRTPRPRPNWAGRLFPGDVRSGVAQGDVFRPDPHVEHQGVGDGERDRRQPRRMHKGQGDHFRGHGRVVGVMEEAIRSAVHQGCARYDDQPRVPVLPQHRDALPPHRGAECHHTNHRPAQPRKERPVQ